MVRSLVSNFITIETPIQIGICLYELGRYNKALEKLNLGIKLAKYLENNTFTTDNDGKTITVHTPKTELIRKAEKYILKTAKKAKGNR